MCGSQRTLPPAHVLHVLLSLVSSFSMVRQRNKVVCFNPESDGANDSTRLGKMPKRKRPEELKKKKKKPKKVLPADVIPPEDVCDHCCNNVWQTVGEPVRQQHSKVDGEVRSPAIHNPATGETLRCGAAVELELPDDWLEKGIPHPGKEGWFHYFAFVLSFITYAGDETYAHVLWLASSREFDSDPDCPHEWIWRAKAAGGKNTGKVPLNLIKRGVTVQAAGTAVSREGV